MSEERVGIMMEEKLRQSPPIILEKSLGFSVLAVQLFRDIQRDDVGRIIGKQFLRAATSIGANVHEAQAGQSKADFIAKISIAHKEARETAYWLALIEKLHISQSGNLGQVSCDCNQLMKILASILLTSKGVRKNHPS